MNGDIPGLDGRSRALTAAVVRYHNRKAEPEGHHISYGTLNNNDRRLARRLASLVRVAEGLDHSHRQRINRIRAVFQRGAVGLQLESRGDASEDIRDANRSAQLFEKEFHTRLYFRPLGG
jgi:exopolyphosphatase/guanosine-5'-triphosphate,3'-diphosphate pyrophosphatase